MSHSLIHQRQLAKEFIARHLAECASELSQWKHTGMLRDGRLRELEKMIDEWEGELDSLGIAESLVVSASLDELARQAEAMDGEALYQLAQETELFDVRRAATKEQAIPILKLFADAVLRRFRTNHST